MSLRWRYAGTTTLLVLLVLVDATLTMLMMEHNLVTEINPLMGNLEDGRFLFKVMWPLALYIGLIRPKEWFVTATVVAANVFAVLIVYECVLAWVLM